MLPGPQGDNRKQQENPKFPPGKWSLYFLVSFTVYTAEKNTSVWFNHLKNSRQFGQRSGGKGEIVVLSYKERQFPTDHTLEVQHFPGSNYFLWQVFTAVRVLTGEIYTFISPGDTILKIFIRG